MKVGWLSRRSLRGDCRGPPDAASLRTADLYVRTLTLNGLGLARGDWRLTGETKADGDISLAATVALASDRDATMVVGADDDFDSLPVAVDIEWFRTDSV